MAFSESFIQELTERNEITDVVSSYVRFTKRSGANQFGLCPFHSEKTPSFSVSPEKQIYHCFGCGKGGGVINFIMEIENLSYPDAVRFLAKRAGLAVPEDKPDENSHRRERMLELNRDAARFFHECLKSELGADARAYIEKRKISSGMVTKFGLGVAPNEWNSLTDAMLRKGYTKTELLDAGLVRTSKKGDGGVYDTFRNRLMFPVIDVRGSVIGFSGRILDNSEPKYMNSPETLLFNKSRNLFALNLAKKSKKGYIILAEGNIDVVALHQAGFDCAVASLGTSLTAEQARLISNYAKEAVIAYDGDKAGLAASQRAIGILNKLDVKVRVLRLTGAKDPDEYISKFGVAAFENLVSRSEDHIEYRLAEIVSKHPLELDEGRVAFLKEAMDYISGLPSVVEREVYASKAAELGKVSPESVKTEVERLRKRRMGQEKRKQENEASRPTRTFQPRAKSIRYDNVRSATAEEGVISLLWLEPELFAGKTDLEEKDFSSPVLGKFYSELLTMTKKDTKVQVALLTERLTGDEMSHFTEIIEKPQELRNSEKALTDYINIIKTEKLASHSGEKPEGGGLLEMAKKLKESKGYGGKG